MALAAPFNSIPDTLVSRERVVAPPERFIDVPAAPLLAALCDLLPDNSAAIRKLAEMLEGLCAADFGALRRALDEDFDFFARAAAGAPRASDARAADAGAPGNAAALDAQEARFLDNFLALLDAGQYRLLTRAEWEAARAEDFLLVRCRVAAGLAARGAGSGRRGGRLCPAAFLRAAPPCLAAWNPGTRPKTDFPPRPNRRSPCRSTGPPSTPRSSRVRSGRAARSCARSCPRSSPTARSSSTAASTPRTCAGPS